MKKFLSLLLAAMMLLSCTTAFAASDTVQNTTHGDWDNTTADIDAYDSVTYSDTTDYDTTAELGTELWMQVTADGQIDVTVPLVLVFQTNIDGGTANTAEDYRISNNNNAEVVVTKVEFDKTVRGGTDKKPMEMVAYADGKTLTENQYMVQLDVVTDTTNGAELVNGNTLNGDYVENTNMTVVDYAGASSTGTNGGKYDMLATSYAKPAKEGGLFKLNKTANGTTKTDTYLDVTMGTGRLSFVTATTYDDEDNEVLDNTKGVHLLTATYTVAIDTSKQYGDVIEGANGSTILRSAENEIIVNVTGNGSGTVTTKANSYIGDNLDYNSYDEPANNGGNP
ncbi:MAG: hypothetical protein IKJ11_05185 [Clostridia bacterium]|nr:hypothetical protein [Clostridia bacterium]